MLQDLAEGRRPHDIKRKDVLLRAHGGGGGGRGSVVKIKFD